MLPRFFAAFALSLFALGTASGQTVSTPDAVDTIVARVAAERENFISTFQNLTALETKSFTIFDRSGRVRKKRVVASNLIIYRLSSSDDLVAEFRNVIAVDGKPLSDAAARTTEFFAKLAKSETSRSELDRIEDESLRYDPHIKISGLTLFQAIAVAENIRPSMRFRVKPAADDSAHDLKIDFEQVAESAFIRVNRGSAPDPNKTSISFEIEGRENEPLNERIRGMLWIDAKSYQVVKEIRETTVTPADFPLPVVISRTTSEYRSSEFGILTPAKITQELFRLDRKRKVAVADITAVFEYSAFTKPDVEVRSAEVK